MTPDPLQIPGYLLDLVAALQTLPGLSVQETSGTGVVDTPESNWMIRLELPGSASVTLGLLRTLVSRAEWHTRGLALTPVSSASDPSRVAFILTGDGPYADPDRLAALVRHGWPTHRIRDEFAALTGALNRVNSARNEVGTLSLHLHDPHQQSEAHKAFHLIVRAEAVLEGLCHMVPVYEEDGADESPPPLSS